MYLYFLLALTTLDTHYFPPRDHHFPHFMQHCSVAVWVPLLIVCVQRGSRLASFPSHLERRANVTSSLNGPLWGTLITYHSLPLSACHRLVFSETDSALPYQSPRRYHNALAPFGLNHQRSTRFQPLDAASNDIYEVMALLNLWPMSTRPLFFYTRGFNYPLTYVYTVCVHCAQTSLSRSPTHDLSAKSSLRIDLAPPWPLNATVSPAPAAGAAT